MKRLVLLLLSLSCLFLHAEDEAIKDENKPFRYPFTLKLHVDKDNYYEENFDEIPYVHKNSVYLFSGENFGVNCKINKDKVQNITYQKDLTKADIEFNFTQKVDSDGTGMMLLIIKNNTKNTLCFDALITVPGKRAIFRTNILPVKPGLSNYESWSHPIIQLVLNNIRTEKEI